MAQSKSGTEQSDVGTVSQRVVTAVAEACSVDPLELPPLYDEIDPDALDQLFHRGFSDGRNGPSKVVFEMADCEVVVNSDSEVTVTAPGERSPASSATNSADEPDEAETLIG